MIRYKFTITWEKAILWKQTSHPLVFEDVPMRGLSGGGTLSLGGDCSQSSFRRRGNFAAFNAAWTSSYNFFLYSHESTTEFVPADSSHFLGFAVAIRACSLAFIVAMRGFLTIWVSFSQVVRKQVYMSIIVTYCFTSGIVRFTCRSCVFELPAPGGLYKHPGDSGLQAVWDSQYYEANKYLVNWFEKLSASVTSLPSPAKIGVVYYLCYLGHFE